LLQDFFDALVAGLQGFTGQLNTVVTAEVSPDPVQLALIDKLLIGLADYFAVITHSTSAYRNPDSGQAT
jgi:hypothetical protein